MRGYSDHHPCDDGMYGRIWNSLDDHLHRHQSAGPGNKYKIMSMHTDKKIREMFVPHYLLAQNYYTKQFSYANYGSTADIKLLLEQGCTPMHHS